MPLKQSAIPYKKKTEYFLSPDHELAENFFGFWFARKSKKRMKANF